MASTLTVATEWAAAEFGGAQLGDRRRAPRLIQVATAMAEDAHGTLPGSFESWAEVKAAYRFLEEPDVTYDRVMAPHRTRVREACRRPGEYLLVEDTTSLDFTSHLAARDLGRIGDDGGRGVFVHSTLALRIHCWKDHEPQITVEGLFDQNWWARTQPTGRRHRSREQRLSQPRESQRWAAVATQADPPPEKAQWTFVADRESDIYETFGRCQNNGWQFIVRACQARALADQGGSVFAAVATQQELGRFSIDLRSRPQQAARRAQVAIRVCPVRLRPPWRPAPLAPRSLQVVEAREVNAPAGVEPIHWVLLTDWPCQILPQALRVIKAYARRWLIEEYHKCLKTGTGIEQSQLETAGHLTALLGILAVVAVRLLNTKLLGTTQPDEPVDCQNLGPESMTILDKKFGRPAKGWTNQTVLVAIARLGGFLARKSDGSPGWLTLWRGCRKLMHLAQGYDLARGQKCG